MIIVMYCVYAFSYQIKGMEWSQSCGAEHGLTVVHNTKTISTHFLISLILQTIVYSKINFYFSF